MDNKLKEKLEQYGYSMLFDESKMTFSEMNKMHKMKEDFFYEKALEFINEFANSKNLKVNKYAKRCAAKSIIVNIEKNEDNYAETTINMPAPKSAIEGIYVLVDNITDFIYCEN